jgi:hypothetical protein
LFLEVVVRLSSFCFEATTSFLFGVTMRDKTKLKYVRGVIESCTTLDQVEVATEWALNLEYDSLFAYSALNTYIKKFIREWRDKHCVREIISAQRNLPYEEYTL